ncbi:hypothetical protein, partial [Brevibacterium celere]|uniref:hypothetical protein n=1 Tax=Brevibacterium celere TaxID=225845 RepID=UPI0031DE62DA
WPSQSKLAQTGSLDPDSTGAATRESAGLGATVVDCGSHVRDREPTARHVRRTPVSPTSLDLCNPAEPPEHRFGSPCFGRLTF